MVAGTYSGAAFSKHPAARNRVPGRQNDAEIKVCRRPDDGRPDTPAIIKAEHTPPIPPTTLKAENAPPSPICVPATPPTTHATVIVKIQGPSAPPTTTAQTVPSERRARKRRRPGKGRRSRHPSATQPARDATTGTGESLARNRRKRARRDRARGAGPQARDPETRFDAKAEPWRGNTTAGTAWDRLPDRYWNSAIYSRRTVHMSELYIPSLWE